ncbi:hypothetical protein V8C37DRAFT_403317 [Trichoderma ceciliae]
MLGEGLQHLFEKNTQLRKRTEEFLKAAFYERNDGVKQEVAEMMLAKAVPILGVTDQHGLTPGNINGLHWIATFGLSALIKAIRDYETSSNLTKVLLSQGAQVNLTEDSHGQGLRLPACDALIFHHERDEFLHLFLDHGGDMTLTQRYNNESLLDKAIQLSRQSTSSMVANVG